MFTKSASSTFEQWSGTRKKKKKTIIIRNKILWTQTIKARPHRKRYSPATSDMGRSHRTRYLCGRFSMQVHF